MFVSPSISAAASPCKVKRSLGSYKQNITNLFLDPQGGSQKATVVLLVVVISSLKNPYGFLNTQRSTTKLCEHIIAHIPYRPTVSDFKINF